MCLYRWCIASWNTLVPTHFGSRVTEILTTNFPVLWSDLELAFRGCPLCNLSLILYGQVIRALAHNMGDTFYPSAPGESNSNLPLFGKLISNPDWGLNLEKGWDEKGSPKPSCQSCSILHDTLNHSFSLRKRTACRGEPLQEDGLSVPHPKNSP